MVKPSASPLSLSQRIDLASQYHRQGYGCAQAVILAFADVTGLSETTAASMTAALGGGLSGSGLTCGAAAAMAMVKGMTCYESPAGKKKVYEQVKLDIDAFAARNCNQVLCRDLRQPGRKPCTRLVADAVEICHNSIFGTGVDE